MRITVTALALLLATGAAAATPPYKVTQIARTHTTVTGQRIVVPRRPDVVVSYATLPPGAQLPVHKHPYPHYVYVIAGTLTLVNTVAHTSQPIDAGQFIAEPQDTWHYGVNNGTDTLTLLTIDQVPEGTKSNTVTKTP